MEIIILIGIIIIDIIILVYLQKKGEEKYGDPSRGDSYEAPVTISLPEWQDYVASGKNVLLGSGGVIPGGTIDLGWGADGAVYKGQVRQGIGFR